MTPRDVLHWPTVGLAFTSMFVLMGSRTSFAVIYPAMVHDQGWAVTDVTSAYSAGLLLYAVLAILIGVGVDRLGCRTMMLVGSILVTVGTVIVGLATEVWHLYVGYILVVGLGTGGIGFITLIKLLSQRTGARFATAFGLAFMGQGLGSLLVSPAVQLIIEGYGWRVASLVFAAVVGLVLLPLSAWIAPGPEGQRAASAVGGRPDTAPGVWSLACMVFLLANASLGFQMLVPTHQVAYLLDLAFAPTLAASAAGGWGAMMSVGSVCGGWLVDRLGLIRMLTFALALITAGTVALVFSGPATGWLLALYVLAGGVGRGLLGVSLGTAQTQLFAGPRLGRMTGILDLGFGTGAFVGPWGAALLHDQIGTFAPSFLATIVASVVGAVGTVVALRLGRR